MAAVIKSVAKNSIASQIGLEAGDEITAINNRAVADVLDYRYLMSDEEIEIEIKTKQGTKEVVVIEKDIDEDLGVEFESGLMDKARSCSNNCIFCFIDQLPPGMRETLYFKDDDTRLSFFQGNYVTLTNVGEKGIARIIDMRISPINVSVHTTNDDLRAFMLQNSRARGIMKTLRRLKDAGIRLNGQIVLCPGYNDAEELSRTLCDLESLSPEMMSVSVVPFGMTRFRDGLCAIEAVDEAKARETLDIVRAHQSKMLAERKTRFVYASDEFYLKARLPLPAADEYEGFPQIENGVGMMASTSAEFYAALGSGECERAVTIATGTGAQKFISALADEAQKRYNKLKVTVVGVKNRFFGESITVAGLLCGRDIIEQLRTMDLGSELILSENMLRDGENVLLDNVTTDEISRTLGVPVRTVSDDGAQLLKAMLGE